MCVPFVLHARTKDDARRTASARQGRRFVTFRRRDRESERAYRVDSYVRIYESRDARVRRIDVARECNCVLAVGELFAIFFFFLRRGMGWLSVSRGF